MNNIIIGGTGFIGKNLVKTFNVQDQSYLSFGSKDLNLLNQTSSNSLGEKINDGDNLFLLTSISPCKNIQMFAQNKIITDNIFFGLKEKKLNKLIIISSDAVYSSKIELVDESSKTNPDSIHGEMQLYRENKFIELDSKIKQIIRITGVYGFGDPHNSYGPNRFIRSAMTDNCIQLDREGQCKRDHIYIDDVSRLIKLISQLENDTLINLVTGISTSFMEVVKIIKQKFRSLKIDKFEGLNSINHRFYDNSNLIRLIGEYNFIKIEDGVRETIHNFQKFGV